MGVTLLLLQSVPPLMSDVTMAWTAMDVGWETPVCQREISVHTLAGQPNLPPVWKMRSDVTGAWTVLAGEETTAWQKDTCAPCLATLLLLLCAALMRFFVTMGLIPTTAGWETTACQKALSVHQW